MFTKPWFINAAVSGCSKLSRAILAGRVTNAQENRLVEGLCRAQGRLAPGQPVHRVAPMLAQIGAALLSQTVDHARLYTVFTFQDKAGARRPCARSAAWRQRIGGSSSLGAVPWA